jgi:hypothetical protein
MAINLQLKTKVNSAFNSAIVSNVRNGITVGGRGGTARGAAGSNGLEGDLPQSAPLGAAPQMAMREPGNMQPGRAQTGDSPSRLQRSPQPAAGSSAPSAEPLHPSTPRTGSGETDAAIRAAAQASGVDVNTMRGIASIESDMNPGSNRSRHTQYKGLYQLGHEEWRRHGSGNIYNAHDNAMAAARLFEANKAQFRARTGRDPTDRELYLMHQQGPGFYSRGAMTNIRGNPYPGMRGPQTHQSFEAGWGRELERRRNAFGAKNSKPSADQGSRGAPVAEPDVGPQSSVQSPYKVASLVQDPKYTSEDINELIGERANEGQGTNTRKPDLNELDNTYDSPQQERFNRPYAYEKDQKDKTQAPQADKDRKEPLPSHFYPPTPGDNEEYPARYNIHQDYHLGSIPSDKKPG